jgi:four helix bundle protein
VWRKAIELSVQVYRFTGSFPREELYGLVSQMRRAAVSVASNIAEGLSTWHATRVSSVCETRGGSNCELQTQLLIAQQLGFGDQRISAQVEAMSNEVGRMLTSLGKYLTREIGAAPTRRSGPTSN